LLRHGVALQLAKELLVDQHQVLDVGEESQHNIKLQEALRVVLWVEARQVQPLVVQFVQIAEICDVRTLRHEHLLRDAVARLLRLLHLLLVAHDWARALAARAASSRVPVFQPLYRTRTTGRRARSAAHHLGRARRRGRWNVTHAAAVRLHEVCRAPGLHDGIGLCEIDPRTAAARSRRRGRSAYRAAVR
jgi:hypothetical protein